MGLWDFWTQYQKLEVGHQPTLPSPIENGNLGFLGDRTLRKLIFDTLGGQFSGCSLFAKENLMVANEAWFKKILLQLSCSYVMDNSGESRIS